MAQKPNTEQIAREERVTDGPQAPEFGPEPGTAAEIRRRLEHPPATETPRVDTVREAITAFGNPPWNLSDRRIEAAEITRGDPRHGAKMSAAHISRYVVRFARECPECGSQEARYQYSRHHNMAGSFSILCPTCNHVHEREEWG